MKKKYILTLIICVFFSFFSDVKASTVEGNKIADAGAQIAVQDGSKYYVEYPYTKIVNSSTQKFINTREKYISGTDNDNIYASCDVGVATAVRSSGVDPEFEPFNTPVQYRYLKSSTDKWKRVGSYKLGQSTVELQPGDVMITDFDIFDGYGHIWLYLGNKAVQKYWPGSNSDFLNSGYCDGYMCSSYPSLLNTQTYEDSRPYAVFRYIGHSDNEDIQRWAELQNVSKKIDLSNVNACNIISDDLADILSEIFSYICIVGIILVVVMTILDLIKAITGNAVENLSKAFKNFIVRIIVVILLLVLPFVVTLVINLTNSVGSDLGYNKDNPLCGVAK